MSTNSETTRIDHRSEALGLHARIAGQPGTQEAVATLAQVHATLYLAEQQRIANVIAYWQLHTPRSVEETGYIEVGQLYTDETNVDEMVRDALGII